MSNDLLKIEIVIGIIFILIFASLGFSYFHGTGVDKVEIYAKKSLKETFSNNNFLGDYTHNVFLGIGTSQNCEPCHWWNEIIHETYSLGLYDFDYVEMIEFDHDGKILNEKANQWSKNYEISSYPTSIFDGDFFRIKGNYYDELDDALNASGSRPVSDIDTSLTLTWLEEAKIQVNISIDNNEETQYLGYIHAFITEIESRYDTYYGEPYHFGFLDFAFDNSIIVPPEDTFSESIVWDGNEHEDTHGDDFGDIIESNIQITLVVYNESSGYVDESISERMIENSPPIIPYSPVPQDGETDVDVEINLNWKGGDPDGDNVFYDVYFSENNPPQKIVSNQSATSYDLSILEYDTDYFWKIVAWDEHGLKSEGEIWKFTTKNYNYLEAKISIPKENSFYLRNMKLFSLPGITFIYGPINIIANVTSSIGVEKVEFFINDKNIETDTEYPYEYKWSSIISGKFSIKIIAYDNEDNQDEDELTIFKWRAHPVIIFTGILLIALMFLK